MAQHEHDEDNENCECGQHKKLSPEKKAKFDSLVDKSKALMTEVVELTATEEDKTKFEEKFKEIFKKHKIPWVFSSIKHFQAGMEFGMFIVEGSRDQGMIAQTVMHLQRIVNNMDKDIKSRTPKI